MDYSSKAWLKSSRFFFTYPFMELLAGFDHMDPTLGGYGGGSAWFTLNTGELRTLDLQPRRFGEIRHSENDIA